MVLAGSWFFSAQVTALLFVPLLLAGACYAPMARGLKLGVVLVLLLMAGQAAGHWQARLQCPEDARGAPAAQLLTPAQLIHRVNQNFDHYLESHRDLERILFTAAHGISKPQVPADTFLAYCGILLAAAVFYVKPEQVLLFALAGSWLLQAGVQNAKGLHDVALMWPCFGLICALAAAQPLWREAAAKYHRRALLGLVAVAAASQGALLSGYVPLLRAAYAQADEYGALDNGGLLLRPTGHAQVAEGIRATALLCGIGNSAESRHVLLDPLAYFAMQDTAQPLLLSQSQPDRKKLFGLLQARGSDGAVLRCPLLPPEVRAMAIEEDGMCCLTREAIAWVEP
ncbi:MAG: hypothetical protein EBX37_14650 [Alphaproteobacteria bacterium]|nr:hypothetical protein [Alphaproteobacteria bacterium]